MSELPPEKPTEPPIREQKNLFGIGPASGGVVENDPQARQWAMVAHLSTFAGFVVPCANIFAPLVVWQIKKEEMPFVVDQAKEAMNFQISLTIYALVGMASICIGVGAIVLPIVGVFDIAYTIIAAVKSNEGVEFRYPLTIRFVT